jgi:hypothetical protein
MVFWFVAVVVWWVGTIDLEELSVTTIKVEGNLKFTCDNHWSACDITPPPLPLRLHLLEQKGQVIFP